MAAPGCKYLSLTPVPGIGCDRAPSSICSLQTAYHRPRAYARAAPKACKRSPVTLHTRQSGITVAPIPS